MAHSDSQKDALINERWTITDHVCRVCFARVLKRGYGSPDRTYRCSNCGAEATGRTGDEHLVCACGIKLKNGHAAGIRCIANPERTPEFPGEIIAEQALK